MIRIIDGVAYMGKPGSEFRVKVSDLGNGHLEASAVRTTVWEELEWDATAMECYLDAVKAYEEDGEAQEEKRKRAVKIAANRAKTRVRKLCKAMGASMLLTLTYRENMQDQALCKAHLKEFVRRMRRLVPGFNAVCAFEEQDRGAWHVHMATCGIPKVFKRTNSTGQPYEVKSFDAIRAIWRGVTKELGGNIDLQRRKFHSDRSPAKIAAYISKYITKNFEEGEKFTNRWTKFGSCDVAPSVDMGTFPDARQAMAKMVEWLDDTHSVVLLHYSHFGDWAVLHAEHKAGCTLLK